MKITTCICFFTVLFSLFACSSEKNAIVVAAPHTGNMHTTGDNIFSAIQSTYTDDSVQLIRGDTRCDKNQAAKLAKAVLERGSIVAIVGPYCVEAFRTVQSLLSKTTVPVLPLVSAPSYQEFWQAESDILVPFVRDKLQSTSTLIAYVANEYGTSMVDVLVKTFGKNNRPHMLPLSSLLQTSQQEAEQIVKGNHTAIILAAYHPKAQSIIKNLAARGSNALLVLTHATQPDMLLKAFHPQTLTRTRFVTPSKSLADINNNFFAHQALEITQLLHKIIANEPYIIQSPTLRLVRVTKDGTLAFDP